MKINTEIWNKYYIKVLKTHKVNPGLSWGLLSHGVVPKQLLLVKKMLCFYSNIIRVTAKKMVIIVTISVAH